MCTFSQAPSLGEGLNRAVTLINPVSLFRFSAVTGASQSGTYTVPSQEPLNQVRTLFHHRGFSIRYVHCSITGASQSGTCTLFHHRGLSIRYIHCSITGASQSGIYTVPSQGLLSQVHVHCSITGACQSGTYTVPSQMLLNQVHTLFHHRCHSIRYVYTSITGTSQSGTYTLFHHRDLSVRYVYTVPSQGPLNQVRTLFHHRDLSIRYVHCSITGAGVFPLLALVLFQIWSRCGGLDWFISSTCSFTQDWSSHWRSSHTIDSTMTRTYFAFILLTNHRLQF